LVCFVERIWIFGHRTYTGQFGKAIVEFWLGVMSGNIAWMIPRHTTGFACIEIVVLVTHSI